ncbi:MAG: glutaredoxin 3 [Rhodospirillaceae bacterium]|nr:glutaredoxin 3 [Rhodospirillaceae bacterium]MBL6930662.1 glutaredoxin 3 [Rhodospirillales bacterium]
MAEVEIYTSALCGYSHRAKHLLGNKGVKFVEYDVTFDQAKRQEMTERTGGKTSVPQVFIDGKSVGGSDDLIELDLDDELDPMLGIAP